MKASISLSDKELYMLDLFTLKFSFLKIQLPVWTKKVDCLMDCKEKKRSEYDQEMPQPQTNPQHPRERHAQPPTQHQESNKLSLPRQDDKNNKNYMYIAKQETEPNAQYEQFFNKHWFR